MASVFGSTFLVFGPESVTAERAVRDRISTATAERAEASVTIVDASELDVGRLTEVAGGSLFADSSVVVVQNLGELSADVAGAVLELAASPFPELSLVLVHAGGAKGRGVLDKLKKVVSEKVECAALKAWQLPNFATQETRFQGGRIERAASVTLVEAVGQNTSAIAGAIKQLLADSDDKFITDVKVRQYFAGRADLSSFAMADDVMAGNATAALEKARWIMATGDSPASLTSALASALRQIGKYLDIRSSGMSDQALAQQIGVPAWKIKDISRTARSWKPDSIAAAIVAVAKADAEVKGAGVDPGYAIDKMILSVTRARKGLSQ